MKLNIKKFNELTVNELYEIYKARVDIFVVEQECPYPEVDEADKYSYHIWLEDEGEIAAYLRVVPPNVIFEEPSLGRIISVKRSCGYGAKIVKEGIEAVKRLYDTDKIKIKAQQYAEGFYNKFGFKRVSDEFMDDGIPHIYMVRN